MPYIVLAPKLAFQKVKANSPTEPDGPEEVVNKGGFVPDYTTEFLINTLSASGLIAYAEAQRPDLRPADELPPQVRTPDQPLVLPSDPNGVPSVLGDRPEDTQPADDADDEVVPADPEPTGPVAPLPSLPKSTDNKEAWESYATLPQIGLTLAEAESKNKTDLMAEVKRRYEAATS